MAMGWSDMAAANLVTFGEAVTYVKASAATRSITALVDRNPAQPLSEPPSGIRPLTTVAVLNSATLGISASELETSTDTIKFAKRVGGTAESWSIARLLDQDETMLLLEVR